MKIINILIERWKARIGINKPSAKPSKGLVSNMEQKICKYCLIEMDIKSDGLPREICRYCSHPKSVRISEEETS